MDIGVGDIEGLGEDFGELGSGGYVGGDDSVGELSGGEDIGVGGSSSLNFMTHEEQLELAKQNSLVKEPKIKVEHKKGVLDHLSSNVKLETDQLSTLE